MSPLSLFLILLLFFSLSPSLSLVLFFFVCLSIPIIHFYIYTGNSWFMTNAKTKIWSYENWKTVFNKQIFLVESCIKTNCKWVNLTYSHRDIMQAIFGHKYNILGVSKVICNLHTTRLTNSFQEPVLLPLDEKSFIYLMIWKDLRFSVSNKSWPKVIIYRRQKICTYMKYVKISLTHLSCKYRLC